MDSDNDFVSVSPTSAREYELLRPAPTASNEIEKISDKANESSASIVLDDSEYDASASIDPATWSTLSSLLPLFQLLPALKVQSGYRTICGPITHADISILRAHAKLVRVLSIVDAPTRHASPEEAEVAASVYTQLMRHLHSDLLPNLESLRLNMQTVSTTQVQHVYPLLFGLTLRELELNDITHDLQHLTVPFLSSLPYQAPALQKLALRSRSGSPSSSEFIGSVISNLTKLRHLELHDVLDEVTPDFLRIIGGLPELVTFIIRDMKTKVTAFDNDAEIKGFKALRTLDITASFRLISCLLQHIESSTVESIAVSPVADKTYHENDGRDVEARRVQDYNRARAVAEETVARISAEEAERDRITAVEKAAVEEAQMPPIAAAEEPEIHTACEMEEIARGEEDDSWGLPIKKKKPGKKGKGMGGLRESAEEARARIDEEERRARIAEEDRRAREIEDTESASRKSAEVEALSVVPWAETMEKNLELIGSRWLCLRNLEISLVDTCAVIRVFELPSRYLDHLKFLKNIKSLKLDNWRPDKDFETTIYSLIPCLPQLESLHFPLGKFKSSVDVRTLQVIADNCPTLKYLQIGLSLRSGGASNSELVEKYRSNTHPLSILSVASDSVPSDISFKEGSVLAMTLTRLLDALFPALRNIITHPGQDSDFWEGIQGFLRVCQDVRGNERVRNLKSSLK